MSAVFSCAVFMRARSGIYTMADLLSSAEIDLKINEKETNMVDLNKKIKITIKYDDGKEKVTLYVDANEMEICLEKDYQHRLSLASPEERKTIRKSTLAEFVDRLNKDSYNSWQKLHRHTITTCKKSCHDEDGALVEPLELIADNTFVKEISNWLELAAIREKLYNTLPKGQADLLWAIAIDQVSVAEIALRAGVSARAIYLRLDTARKNFKKVFPNPSLFRAAVT